MRKKQKVSNNKGFSLVELIIVIAIMAILAGALAPQLIKYIDKSRKSADVQTAQTIATAVSSALANEEAYNIAGSTDINTIYTVVDGSTANAFQKEIYDILGKNKPEAKYSPSSSKTFFIVLDSDKSFKIYINTAAPTTDAAKAATIVYPTVGTDYK